MVVGAWWHGWKWYLKSKKKRSHFDTSILNIFTIPFFLLIKYIFMVKNVLLLYTQLHLQSLVMLIPKRIRNISYFHSQHKRTRVIKINWRPNVAYFSIYCCPLLFFALNEPICHWKKDVLSFSILLYTIHVCTWMAGWIARWMNGYMCVRMDGWKCYVFWIHLFIASTTTKILSIKFKFHFVRFDNWIDDVMFDIVYIHRNIYLM